MIEPKVQQPTKAQEKAAYELATIRDGGVCQRCRRDCGPIARDHRKNRSTGGLTVASNLQLLGLACHTWKSEHPAAAAHDGWAVPGWPEAIPSEWPARRWVPGIAGILHKVWVLLDDAGGWVEISDAEAARRMVGVP